MGFPQVAVPFVGQAESFTLAIGFVTILNILESFFLFVHENFLLGVR
jgi:hypothetical protein